MDVVSNENFYRFRIETLSLCKAITFRFAELLPFSPALRPVGSVSIIEPEAPGVLLRLYSIFGDIYYALLQKYKELGKRSAVVPRWQGAREELRRATFLLPSATVRTARDTAPVLFVSDAEDANARDFGGAGQWWLGHCRFISLGNFGKRYVGKLNPANPDLLFSITR